MNMKPPGPVMPQEGWHPNRQFIYKNGSPPGGQQHD
jgi:hypothetical protein